MKRKVGMVLGKFMPPHMGHILLNEFAQSFVGQLYIVVGTLAAEPIPGELRYKWMKELFPGSTVLHLRDENPQHPEEDPDFWEIWKNSLLKILPEKPDYVFASEDYGWKLAEVLGAEFIPVDLSRSNLPISGTAIRNEPFKNWDYLPRCVRPYFLKRICIFGPESCGKSTLARELGEYFNTSVVPEYAESYIRIIKSQGRDLEKSDFIKIAKGQRALEEAISRNVKQYLISDTDVISTCIWSEWLTGECSQELSELANKNKYDLYLLCAPDLPWEVDQHRYLPNDRINFFERCKNELIRRGLNYEVIQGEGNIRVELAKRVIQESILKISN